ncbi:uncharacterized protein LOC132301027 [Cornus florida]|uniref:uncharacterized protein LOC132301027 n=1 Tax=Cornus florida TaxID=4283 RepID=UPI0028A1847F|nr:uncharacterized protein LOC132301027 [Cornus florida]
MGSECNPNKPHYDITMSKRTRRRLNLEKEISMNSCSREKQSDPQESVCKVEDKSANGGEESDHQSLKQLMHMWVPHSGALPLFLQFFFSFFDASSLFVNTNTTFKVHTANFHFVLVLPIQMGSECNPTKPHYDITMSKRTRRRLDLEKEANLQISMNSEKGSDCQESVCKVEDKSANEGEENDHKSLKQLIKTTSLGEHFTEEEKQLQIVVKQEEDGIDGVKFKRMVSRYAKILSHLIKLKKKDPHLGSRKKPVLQLKM